MIYQDASGFPLEQHGDGGDSSMRAGMGLLTDLFTDKSFDALRYTPLKYGWAVRHPTQYPWNNPFNFTRDQLIPLIAGLNRIKETGTISYLALSHLSRLGFCQDFERDKIGTWKHPWPATYIDDKGNKVFKWFDFADPLLPNDWWCLIKGAKWYPFYLLFPICAVFMIGAILSSASISEQNQIIAALSFYPKWFTRFYVKCNPMWYVCNTAYWASRNENEYGAAIHSYICSRIANE